MTDVIILGGGPSGLTAALYSLRSGLNVTLIEKGAPGGQLLNTEAIENYPGFPEGIKGMELATNFFTQISSFPNLNYVTGEVTSLTEISGGFRVTTTGETYEGKTVIISSGGSPRYLEVPGEAEYTGKGVSYCAICDGFFFRDKIVAVVGGGNTAVEDALYLSGIAKEVYLIHRRDTFRASPLLTSKLKEKENIHLKLSDTPTAVLGEDRVTGVVLQNETLAISGIFIAIGQEMNTGFLGNLIELDENDAIRVNEHMQTSIPGIFACGDVISKPLRQVSTAVGDGAIAGQEVYHFLERGE